jgi:heme/copper-type cytochrome/quinol oxidase subunit 2
MKAFIKKVSGAGTTVLGTLLALPVFAQETNLLNDVAGNTTLKGGSEGGLATMLGKLINTALSVLGVVLLLIVIYAGFLWMTAGGEAAKTQKAKDMITNATIGLVLILAALAISTFVFDTLTAATTV